MINSYLDLIQIKSPNGPRNFGTSPILPGIVPANNGAIMAEVLCHLGLSYDVVYVLGLSFMPCIANMRR